MANEMIREKAKRSGVPLWKIARELGISEPTITRKLRVDLSDNDKQRVIAIIDRLGRESA